MTAPRETPNQATSTKPGKSSARVARKKPLAWLPYVGLLLIALLVLLVLLVINAVDDDGPEGPAGDSLGQLSGDDGGGGGGGVAAPAAPTAPSLPTQQPTASAPAPTGGSGSAGSALTADGDDLIAASGGSLADREGQAVTGVAAVESVVSDEGFWVGSSPAMRVFVFLTPEARQSAGESGFQVTAGQSVQLTGSVVSVASSPDSVAGVTDAEGAQQVQQQGAFVQADTVELSS